MHSCSKLATALAATLTLALAAGCAAGPGGGQARTAAMDDAAGPRELLAKWHRALVTGDKNAYVACMAGSDNEIVLALASLEAVQANYAFHDAVVGVYGADAWKGFSSGPAQIDIFPKDEAWTRRITVVRTGSTAMGYLPHAKVPLVMVETGGVWRLHAASLVPPGFEAKEAADYQYRWAGAIRGMAEQVRNRTVGTGNAAAKVDESLRAKFFGADAGRATRAVTDSFLVP